MPNNDRLHRRSIRAALIRNRRWVVESRVDGWVDVKVPRSAESASAFAKEVRAEVEALGYVPTIAIGAGSKIVRVRTPETLAQAGRGEHHHIGSLSISQGPATTPPPKVSAASDADEIGLRSRGQSGLGATSGKWISSLRPSAAPRLELLSKHSELFTWAIETTFRAFRASPNQESRWLIPDVDSAETWRKRPLLVGEDSGCEYSCGEVELAARLRNAGLNAYWVSEWSGFPHVPMWQHFCVKRSELHDLLPSVWEFDKELRTRFPQLLLGKNGGHPDVVAWWPDSVQFLFVEYKGPADSVKPKQNSWVRALTADGNNFNRYVAVRGLIESANTT